MDPLAGKYPFYSPYAFSGNRVIDAVEREGLEPHKVNGETVWGPYTNEAVEKMRSGNSPNPSMAINFREQSLDPRRRQVESLQGKSFEAENGTITIEAVEFIDEDNVGEPGALESVAPVLQDG